jgi:hypothetical protein
MAIILVQNEVTAGGKYDFWDDDTGVRYHFPNQYINKVKEGEWFIYYRGSRRKNKSRAVPEYFGFGRISKISPDPQNDYTQSRKYLRWYCEFVDYIPFAHPVPFKIDGDPFEKVADNLWSVAVRNISSEVFHLILAKAGIPIVDNEPIINLSSPIIPSINDVNPLMVTEEQKLLLPSDYSIRRSAQPSTSENKWGRHSKYAKIYGDHSEHVVYKILVENRSYKLRWVAKDKEKPGWDIEYYDNNKLVAVEVKGTSGKRFLNVDITAGEWNAAREKGANYHLYLVADCLSKEPRIQVVTNPYRMYLRKQLSIDPILYRLRLNK